MTLSSRQRYRLLSVGLRAAVLIAVLTLRTTPAASFADTVKVTVPTSLAFAVHNVTASTTGSPNPLTMSFSSLSVLAGHSLRVSLKADADFTPPSGAAIPASNLSWTISSATNGAGSAGTLSKTVYTQAYQSTVGKTTGSVGLQWILAAPGTGIRAGVHTLTLRWKFESV